MFEIKRDGTDVKIIIDPVIPGAENWTYNTRIFMKEETCAQLLVNAINDRMRKCLKNIRNSSYEQGWKDAKAHKTGKETWFSGSW
jgi:hypothetical protein